MKLETLLAHAGRTGESPFGAVVPPLVLSTTFAHPGQGEVRYEYARTANPTRDALESSLAALEGGKHGLAFSSGLAAATAAFQLLSAGDEILVGHDIYPGTLRILFGLLGQVGIAFQSVDFGDLDAVRAAITPATRLIWLETPTNPSLRVHDIARIAEIARSAGAYLAVDNTLATPLGQRPLELGAHLVSHSVTKALNGHSDVMGGALVTGDDELGERLRFIQNAAGAVPSPFDCYLTLRGLKTLHLRMERASANALALARWLSTHPAIAHVRYPGLESSAGYALARRQMSLFGTVVSPVLKASSTEDAAARVARLFGALRVITPAHSLGGVESLVEYPAQMSHAGIPEEMWALAGVEAGMVRISVGVEHLDDLKDDLERALGAIG